ncbi:hypothetical protein BJV82DRAFT_379782 [Fennellomyces sp. T-0311]|nr:hypothetical protein BJV82DRAFT_379782 [Fennellomyces sp. T-0311]
MNQWRLLSETDIFRIFFSPILEIVFTDSMVKLRSGETQNTASKDVFTMISKGDTANSRGAYKVDLRLVLVRGGKSHDLSNCEFAKNGELERKVITDNVKLVAEGKCIIDHIVRTANLKHKKARRLQVVNVQGCGLKMLLTGIKLDASGQGYVAGTIGKTIRFPHTVSKIRNFLENGLPMLYYLRETAETNARILQDALNKDDSLLGSQSPQIPRSFLKQTWFGPRPSDPKRVPQLPY